MLARECSLQQLYVLHAATHCNNLQHTTTHCSTLQQCGSALVVDRTGGTTGILAVECSLQQFDIIHPVFEFVHYFVLLIRDKKGGGGMVNRRTTE